MEKKVTPATRAAVALTVALAKNGNIQGTFKIPEMARIINRETGLPELLQAIKEADGWLRKLHECYWSPHGKHHPLRESLIAAIQYSEAAIAKAECADQVDLKTSETRRKASHSCNISPAQERALQQFLECWNLSMPYHDIGSALNCGECNALYQLLLAFDAPGAAQALLESHAVADDEGDDPEHFRVKIALEER